jgi:hypothetical protein
MIAEAIIQLLTSLAPLVAIVGDKISPNVVLVGEITPAVYVLDSEMDDLNCDNPNGQYYGTVEIGVHSQDYAQCDKGIKEIRKFLKGFNDEVTLYSDGSVIGLKVESVRTEPDGYVEEDRNHVKVMTLEVFAKVKS